jgi:DNA polymerase III alpha subunit (gram-positive type)
MTERDAHGNVVDTFEALFSIPEEILDIRGTGAVDVHQIKPDDIRDKLPFEHPDVQRKVLGMLKDRVLLAHNAGFEDRFLIQNLDGYAEMDIPVIDSVKLSKMFVPETPNNKLETLAPAMGVPYTNGHRALHDAEVNADAYYPLTQRIFNG